MDFLDVLSTRESIRSYDPMQTVAKDILIKILDAGRLAPSAANKQPWRFVLASSEEKLVKVKACYDKPWFHDAPHILIVVGNKQQSWIRRYDNRNFIETDLAIALDHMILTATNEGIGTCWISNFQQDVLYAALDLKENECVYGLTPLGYPKSDYSKKGYKERKSFDEVVDWM
jgi:nitroreductase